MSILTRLCHEEKFVQAKLCTNFFIGILVMLVRCLIIKLFAAAITLSKSKSIFCQGCIFFRQFARKKLERRGSALSPTNTTQKLGLC